VCQGWLLGGFKGRPASRLRFSPSAPGWRAGGIEALAERRSRSPDPGHQLLDQLAARPSTFQGACSPSGRRAPRQAPAAAGFTQRVAGPRPPRATRVEPHSGQVEGALQAAWRLAGAQLAQHAHTRMLLAGLAPHHRGPRHFVEFQFDQADRRCLQCGPAHAGAGQSHRLEFQPPA